MYWEERVLFNKTMHTVCETPMGRFTIKQSPFEEEYVRIFLNDECTTKKLSVEDAKSFVESYLLEKCKDFCYFLGINI